MPHRTSYVTRAQNNLERKNYKSWTLNVRLWIVTCLFVIVGTLPCKRNGYTPGRKYWKDNKFCIWVIFIVLILPLFIAMSLLFRSEWWAGIILKSAHLLAYSPRSGSATCHPLIQDWHETSIAMLLNCYPLSLLKRNLLGKAFVCTIWTLSQLAENEWDWITEGCIACKSIPSDTPFNKFCTSWFANVEQWMMLCGVCQTLG